MQAAPCYNIFMHKRALIYQIYPKSFGSINDIIQRLPEIVANFHPDYLWLNPLFLSPWQEGGYDVADYLAIDPQFGSIKDFQKLIAVAKKHKLGILLDLVINHSSNEHIWFQKSRYRDPIYSDYYVWLDKPLNWRSFFGGPAFEYDAIRGQYYLHLFDKTQPDLNFENPRVVREFKKIIDFWAEQGVSGFRVDSANVLSESSFRHGFLPQLPGFFLYFQNKNTIKVLEKLFARKDLFTLAEPVGGHFFSHKKARELTRRAFDAIFNIGTLDVADTYFSNHAKPLPLNYKKWFKKLARWTTKEPKLSFALESHDTPRAVSRFKADAKSLAMLQFLLPSNYPCIYQGQELGTPNPPLGDKIEDYLGVQSRALYQKLIKDGHHDKEAIAILQRVSRDNARVPLNWADFAKQKAIPNSNLNFYIQLVKLWREDEILAHGNLSVQKIDKKGIFDFRRNYKNKSYYVHIDLSGLTPSTLINDQARIILSTR